MFMSVVNRDFVQDADVVVAAYWRATGELGADAPAGEAEIGLAGGDLGFLVSGSALSGRGVLDCVPCDVPEGPWALRVDEVAFPVGAIAHRHTHSGSGWRHLVSGALRIEAEHGTSVMEVGDSWYEPANSPVRAVALQTEGVTRFVRCMVVPAADLGRSTFKLASPADADLPRLQSTHRHVDHLVQEEAG